MQIHQLKLTHKRKTVKRIGRGGKRGTYSGRGQKGQSSRSGHRTRPAERDVIQRLPKLRGIKFKPFEESPVVFNVGDLEKRMKDNIISLDSLLKGGFIRKSQKEVKILGEGNITRPFEIKGLKVSESAKKKIEAAGGKVSQVSAREIGDFEFRF